MVLCLRTLLHVLQFALTYFLMLCAMTFNGGIILTILAGITSTIMYTICIGLQVNFQVLQQGILYLVSSEARMNDFF